MLFKTIKFYLKENHAIPCTITCLVKISLYLIYKGVETMNILKPCAIALAVSIFAHNVGVEASSHQEADIQHQGGEIDMQGLEALLNSKVPLSLVDARSDKYFDGTLIRGAQRLPAESEQITIEKTLPNKNGLVVVYCGGIQCPASKNLAKRLAELGYTNVMDYHGGIHEWKANNKPTQGVEG